MKRFLSILGMAILAFIFTFSSPAQAAEKKVFKVAWSHYTGWEPWQYAVDSGIMKKWADKNGIVVKIDLINDYVGSINQYTSGAYDAVVATNMDTLSLPAIAGVDSEAIIIGDYSNGNDGVVVTNGTSCADLKGRQVTLYTLTVSHYLLSRCLEMSGVKEASVHLRHSTDDKIGAVFSEDSDPKKVVVTWNPVLMGVRNVKGAKMIFDSSKIPEEILDLMIVKTAAPESLKKALAGAWYEMMQIMNTPGKARDAAVAEMAKSAGGTLAEFEAQVKTTRFYYDPGEGASFAGSKKIKDTMEYIRTFTFDHGLYGQDAASKDVVGIQFPDGTVLGNKKNVKMRYVDKYMKLAADGKLTN